MAFEDFDFIPLKVDTEIKPFKCKYEDLNGFLLDDARKYLVDLMAVTYLLEDSSANKTVAYFSLLNDKISSDPERHSIWNKLSRRIPIIKYLFTHGNRTGCRFITVDAYKDAVGFYQKSGFDFITDKDQYDETRLMFYDLKRFVNE